MLLFLLNPTIAPALLFRYREPLVPTGVCTEMALPLDIDTEPMEARPVAVLPSGAQWRYEPKWDGFRCLAFRDGESVELRSKSGQPLERYFPDVVAALAALPA